MFGALVFIFCLFVSPARAATYSVADATADIADLAPKVAEVAGRPFLVLPPVRFVDHAELAERAPQFARVPAGEVLGVYAPHEDRILIVREGIVAMASLTPADDDALRREVRRVLAHELVHTLQFQWAPPPIGDHVPPEVEEGWRIVSEGQAEWVGGQVQESRLDELRGRYATVPVADDDVDGRRYVVGPQAVRAVVERYGAEGVWSVLIAPRPAGVVFSLGEAARSCGWRDVGLLDGTVRALGGFSRAGERGLISPSFVARQLGGLPPAPDPAGLYAETHVNGDAVQVFALAFGSDERAHELLLWRARHAKAMRPGWSIPVLMGSRFDEMFARFAPHRADRLEVDELLVVEATSHESRVYQETWARRGAVVVLIGSLGNGLHQAREDGALRAFLDHAPSFEPTEAQRALLETRLALFTPAAGAAAAPSAVWFGSELGRRLAPQDPARCLEIADMVRPDEETMRWVARAAHACAVAAGATSAADTWRKRAGVDSSLLPDARVRHAALLGTAGRPKEGLDMLGVDWPPDERVAQDWATARLLLLVQVGRRADVEALAKDPRPDPDARLAAAAWLQGAGRAEAASAIRRALCSGPPQTVPPVCADAG